MNGRRFLAVAILAALPLAGCSWSSLWGGGPTATQAAQTAEEKRLAEVDAWRKTIDAGRLVCSAADAVGDAALAAGKIDQGERKVVQVGIQNARRALRLANAELLNFLNGIAEEASVAAKVAYAQTNVTRVEKSTADLKRRETLEEVAP